jgi:hypothetical protein
MQNTGFSHANLVQKSFSGVYQSGKVLLGGVSMRLANGSDVRLICFERQHASCVVYGVSNGANSSSSRSASGRRGRRWKYEFRTSFQRGMIFPFVLQRKELNH